MGRPRVTGTDSIVYAHRRNEPEYYRQQARAYAAKRYEIRSAWYREALASQRCAACGAVAESLLDRNGASSFRPTSSLTFTASRFLAAISALTPLCMPCSYRLRNYRDQIPAVFVDTSAFPPMPW